MGALLFCGSLLHDERSRHELVTVAEQNGSTNHSNTEQSCCRGFGRTDCYTEDASRTGGCLARTSYHLLA